jgi:hypothetical protein
MVGHLQTLCYAMVKIKCIPYINYICILNDVYYTSPEYTLGFWNMTYIIRYGVPSFWNKRQWIAQTNEMHNFLSKTKRLDVAIDTLLA